MFVIAVNGKFSGPTFNVTTNENVIVNVRNKLNENVLVTWPGVQMRRISWQDGVLGTNCPIRPGWNWTYEFQALRSSLDSGKDLGMPDGVLINGKGPYQYNASVSNGIDYETINVDQGNTKLYIHTGALPDPPNDAYDTSYAVNQAMSIRLWLLEYCATDEALSGMHPGQVYI
ncbi:hypothetical protein AgCh_036713 [Apium graveolens]